MCTVMGKTHHEQDFLNVWEQCHGDMQQTWEKSDLAKSAFPCLPFATICPATDADLLWSNLPAGGCGLQDTPDNG